MMLGKLYYFIILFLVIDFSICQETESELLMVKIVFRHGKSGPPTEEEFKKLLNLAVKDQVDFEPFKSTTITEEAKEDMYNLGVKFRRRYANSLFEYKYPKLNEVLMESTDQIASQVSAKIVSSGIFKESKKEILKKKWNETELSKMTNKSEDKYLTYFYKERTCEHAPYKYLAGAVDNKYNQFNQFWPSKTIISQNVGLPKTKWRQLFFRTRPWHVWKIYEYYKSQEYSGIQIPDWLTEDVLLDMQENNKLFMEIMFEATNNKKRSGGIYVHLLVEEFKKAVNKENVPKLQLLSAQQTVVVAATAALASSGGQGRCSKQKFKVKVPQHGDSLIAELHKNKTNQEVFVKIFYWEDKSDEPEEITYEYCEGLCTWSKFQQLTKHVDVTPDNLKLCSPV